MSDVTVHNRLNGPVGIVGAGAWGTALALVAARAGNKVILWGRDAEAMHAAQRDRRIARLPGVALDDGITATADGAALGSAPVWLLALPAQTLRSGLKLLAQHAPAAVACIITAKGIEQGTDRFLTDVLADEIPNSTPLVLSGPSFAHDVARGLPTAVTLAARPLDLAHAIAERLGTPTFRPYVSDDLVGVQIGGAIKNVLAIAAGIVTGRKLGESARAALIARSFAELNRFGRAFGARPETLAGLSGLGDLVLSASTAQSRNFALGTDIATSGSTAGGEGRLTEGAYTAEAALHMARARGVEVPIIEAVADVLGCRVTVDEAIVRLLQRPLKRESD
jgi:glycerol-3-phosphate dehydrogenase (NAD(P)+)